MLVTCISLKEFEQYEHYASVICCFFSVCDVAVALWEHPFLTYRYCGPEGAGPILAVLYSHAVSLSQGITKICASTASPTSWANTEATSWKSMR